MDISHRIFEKRDFCLRQAQATEAGFPTLLCQHSELARRNQSGIAKLRTDIKYMDDETLKKYLGMALYLCYYNYPRIRNGGGFPPNYCQELKSSLPDEEPDYLYNLKESLEYSINNVNYDCISLLIDNPLKSFYTEDEIKDFFLLFYTFLNDCL